MDINLSFVFLGHAVELHFCIGAGRLASSDREAEVHELSSESEHQLGFQPNKEDKHDDDEDEDDQDDRSGGARAGLGGLRWPARR